MEWYNPVLQSTIYRFYGHHYPMGLPEDESKEDITLVPPFLRRQKICQTFIISSINPMLAPAFGYKIPITRDIVSDIVDGYIEDFDVYRLDYPGPENVRHWIFFMGSDSTEEHVHIKDKVELSDIFIFDDSVYACGSYCDVCEELEKVSQSLS